MGRAPFQVLVFPFRPTSAGDWEYAIYHRSEFACWQGIASGGEDDESPLAAAKREAFEEAGISPASAFIALDSIGSIPVTSFRESHLWGENRFVIPEYAFGAQTDIDELAPSAEHTEIRWLPFTAARRLFRFDGNRVALRELNQRVRGLGPRDVRA